MDGTKRIRADAPPRLCMALLARNPSLAIPIALGRSLMPTFGNEVAHTAQFAPTVGHALAMHARYSAILVKQGKWTLSQSKSFVNFRWSHPESKLDGGIMDATIVAFNWRLLSEATGRKLKPREVYLSSDEIGAPGVYTDYFQSKVVFNAGTESAGLILRKSDLDQAVLMGDYPLFKQCCRMLDVRLECLFERDEKRLQILREVVRTNLAMGDRRFTAIARMLGGSPCGPPSAKRRGAERRYERWSTKRSLHARKNYCMKSPGAPWTASRSRSDIRTSGLSGGPSSA